MPAVDLSDYLSQLDLGANVYLLMATASHEGAGSQVKVVVDTPEGVTLDQIARIGKLLRSDPGLAQRLNPAGYGGDSPDYRIGEGPRRAGHRLRQRVRALSRDLGHARRRLHQRGLAH